MTRFQRLLRTSIRLPGTREDAWAMAGLAAIILFLLRGAVFGGQVLFFRDIGSVWHPQIESLVRCVAAGSWPLWDVYRGFGQPLLADPSAQILYPPTWLNLLVRPWVYYTAFAAGHLLLSGAGLYALARRWLTSPGASFVAAAVWTLSGPLLSLVNLWHHFAGAAWIPWVVLSADVALETGKRRHALVWGIVLAVQILAGSADMVAITGTAVAVYILAHHVRWRPFDMPRNLRLLRVSVMATATGLGLSAALWLPALALARQSDRWGLAADEGATWSVPPLAVLGLLWKVPWGRLPRLTLDTATFRDLHAPWLLSLYLGGPAMALVGASLATKHLPRRAILLVLGGGAVLIALGRYWVAFDVVSSLFPPFRILRYPVKWTILAAFSWSLLAGMGFLVWSGKEVRDRRRWVMATLAPLAAMAAASLAVAWFLGFGGPVFDPASAAIHFGEVRAPLTLAGCLLTAALVLALSHLHVASRVLTLLVSMLAIGDLAGAHKDLQALAPRELFTLRPQALDTLGRQGLSRLYVYDYSVAVKGLPPRHPGFRIAHVPTGWSPTASLALGAQMYLNPPTAGRWGVFGSYDLDLLGLLWRPVARLTEWLRHVEATPSHLRLLRMGAVSHAMALYPDAWWKDLEEVARIPSLFDQPIHVFKVPEPLPRAYVVDGVRVARESEALAILQDPGFDPSREVLLPSGPPVPPGEDPPGTSHVMLLKPDRVQVQTDLRRPGYLVLVDGYDPGWRARVDGKAQALVPANLAFRAVAVPAGRHVVEMTYRPPAVALGFVVSAATALMVLWGGFGRRTPRDAHTSSASGSRAARLAREIEHHREIADRAEVVWNWDSPAGRRRADRRGALFVEEGHLHPGRLALELGCGTGVFLERVASCGGQIRAIDLSIDLLEKARKRLSRVPSVLVACGNAEEMPYPDATFDVVYGSSVLHHLDLDVALAEVFRVLRRNGRAVFTEPNILNPQVAFMFHFGPTKHWFAVSPDEMAFSRFQAARAMMRAGFVDVSVRPFDFLHPSTPLRWLDGLARFGQTLERLPILREIAGSLAIVASKKT